jgi:hypothetical protein
MRLLRFARKDGIFCFCGISFFVFSTAIFGQDVNYSKNKLSVKSPPGISFNGFKVIDSEDCAFEQGRVLTLKQSCKYLSAIGFSQAAQQKNIRFAQAVAFSSHSPTEYILIVSENWPLVSESN